MDHPAIHRTRDPISNFRLRVRLRKAPSSVGGSSVSSNPGAEASGLSRGSTESVRSGDGTEDENEGFASLSLMNCFQRGHSHMTSALSGEGERILRFCV